MPDPTPPSPTQHPGQAVDLDEVRRLYDENEDDVRFLADVWEIAAWVPLLVADLDAAREALRRARPVLEAARALVPTADDRTHTFLTAWDVLAAAVDTYETQESSE